MADSKIPGVKNQYVPNFKFSEDQDIEKDLVEDLILLYDSCQNIIEEYRGSKSVKYDNNPDSNKIHEGKAKCDFCDVEFGNDENRNNVKTLHHSHFTGKYIASICNKCNLTVDI